ncbi:MAG: hypothetical protein ABIJ65_13195 [Chloroflexota bacterium]
MCLTQRDWNPTLQVTRWGEIPQGDKYCITRWENAGSLKNTGNYLRLKHIPVGHLFRFSALVAIKESEN